MGLYGKNWKKIGKHILSKSQAQIKSYFFALQSGTAESLHEPEGAEESTPHPPSSSTPPPTMTPPSSEPRAPTSFPKPKGSIAALLNSSTSDEHSASPNLSGYTPAEDLTDWFAKSAQESSQRTYTTLPAPIASVSVAGSNSFYPPPGSIGASLLPPLRFPKPPTDDSQTHMQPLFVETHSRPREEDEADRVSRENSEKLINDAKALFGFAPLAPSMLAPRAVAYEELSRRSYEDIRLRLAHTQGQISTTSERLPHSPSQLSGDQQRLVAFAPQLDSEVPSLPTSLENSSSTSSEQTKKVMRSNSCDVSL